MNTTVNTISINGKEYVSKDSLRAQVSGPIKIVILQRGWVMVGYYEREGDNCSLKRASIIRNWGTTNGLGQIAANGPTKDTKLDPTNGLVEFHKLTEIAVITCEASKWADKLT